MRGFFLLVTMFVTLFGSAILAQNTVVPNTTLAVETGANTSTSPSFTGTTNGDVGGANVSKIDLHNLLYAGSTTKIYAHFMPWFGNKNHYNVGYNSNNPAQIHLQVMDMISRGISGAVIDWYGPGKVFNDTTAKNFRTEVDAQGGAFGFAVAEDVGAIKACVNTPGCDFTQQFIDDLNYAYATYVSSPNYLRINNQPVYFTFGSETVALDWSRIKAGLLGNPVFILQNSGGFTRPMSGGGFAWVQPGNVTPQDPMVLQYLTGFFWNAAHYPAETTFAGTYKGFDDSIAPWGQNRHIQQNCGQTWLATFAKTNQYFSNSNQLPFLQLVTWNDYEEGTEIETGIDNCVSLAGAVDQTGNLTWSISGGLENTIDHYSVYISLDGQNLMKVTDVAAGQHNLNIGSYNFASGTYSLFVKAWGQPTITNKVSPVIAYTVAAKTPPTAALNLSALSGAAPFAVTAATTNSTAPNGQIVSTVINWGDGSSSPVAVGSHTYTVPGVYAISATVTDNLGLTGTASGSITVLPPASVTITAPANGAQVSLTPTASATGSSSFPIVSMQVFVDGALAAQSTTGTITTALQLTPGAHSIVTQLKDNTNAVASSSITVTAVNQAPHAALSTSVAGSVVTASTANSTDSDGTIAGSVIQWGDGSAPSSGTNATHAYAKSGTYVVTATVTDNYGATATASQQVTVQVVTRRYVQILSPWQGSFARSNVHVSGVGSGPAQITMMQAYVDGNLLYQCTGAALDTHLTLPLGLHSLTLQAADSTGVTWSSSSISFTVH